MLRKDVKYLNTAYKKRLNYIQKHFFDDKKIGLTLFVEYLKYLRDSIVLAEFASNSEASKTKIATIAAATAEIEAYMQTSNKQQKIFHWNTFCELLKQNMEDWLKIDDSV